MSDAILAMDMLLLRYVQVKLTIPCLNFFQVLQHYYPKDVELPEYRNGDSLPIKMANWHQLELFFKKKTNAKKFSKLLLENIEGTIHEKQGAAEVRFQK